jgi:hypothetical protein
MFDDDQGRRLICEWMILCGIGDTAVALLKEEADFTLKNNEGELAIDLAPDKEVSLLHIHLPYEIQYIDIVPNRSACSSFRARRGKASRWSTSYPTVIMSF